MRALIVACVLCASACAPASSGRYVMASDPGSRYGFKYVRDRTTGNWMHREFEIRVDLQRELPPLLVASEIGNSFTVQLFRSESLGSGGIFSAIPVIEGGYRVWRGADVMDDDDLLGRASYGVGVSFPQPGRESRHDPMEIFSMPPLGQTIPEQWTNWETAASMRAGAFGWWEEVHGAPPEPLPSPAHPFEFRWRLVFAEIPGRIP